MQLFNSGVKKDVSQKLCAGLSNLTKLLEQAGQEVADKLHATNNSRPSI